ncbi:MAG: hypothetical protein N3E36_06920 [Sulfolobales archaeon]|nr:hypothetical protein [Ignisphaera sp.]MCX8199726.1 hypothetical protein [Sulfolobales archaeon]MDW8085855.1 RNA-binding domain-containing protein [Ignisphaera sp.]
MTRRIELSEVAISTHCHATEDLDKVKKGLMNVLPSEIRSVAKLHTEVLHGYYGNPIVKLETRVKGEDAYRVVRYVLSMISDTDWRYLLSSLDMRYDVKDNKLFIRLDKQEAYLGNITLYEGDDSIKIAVSFSMIRSAEAVKDFLEKVLKEVKGNESEHVYSS